MKYTRFKISVVKWAVLVSALVFGFLSLTKALIPVAGQGATGRPSVLPSKPKSTPGTKKPKTRPSPTVPARNTNTNNSAANNPTAGANNNRPRQATPAENVNSSRVKPSPSVSPTLNSTNANTNASPGVPGALSPPRSDPAEALERRPLTLDAWPSPTKRVEPKPTFDRTLLIPFSSQSLEGGSGQVIYTKGEFNGLLGKRKVFVHAESAATADRITARLREYGGLEIVKTAAEAEFALHVNSWSHSGDVFMGISKTYKGGTLIVTIRDTDFPVPRIIWRHTEDGEDSAFDKLAKRFIKDLKKLRGEK